MTALVKIACAVCNRRIGEIVLAEDGYVLVHTHRFSADEDPDRMEPHRKQVRHDFTAEPAVTTVCPTCGQTVIGWTLDDCDVGDPSVRELIEKAERTGKGQRHAVGRGTARKTRG